MSSRPEIVESVVRLIRLTARDGIADDRVKDGVYDKYLANCSWLHGFSGTQIIFCRHVNEHGRGVNLSISFRQKMAMASDQLAHVHALKKAGVTLPLAPFNKSLARDWARALFGADHPKLLVGDPYTDIGRRLNMMHFRLCCGEDWTPARRAEMDNGWRFWAEVFGIAA